MRPVQFVVLLVFLIPLGSLSAEAGSCRPEVNHGQLLQHGKPVDRIRYSALFRKIKDKWVLGTIGDALDPLKFLTYRPIVGEVVRFRHSSGRMGIGKVESLRDQLVKVQPEKGQSVEIPAQEVFRNYEGRKIFTPHLEALSLPWNFKVGSLKEPLTREFLNGFARITSAEPFISMSQFRQVRAMVDYLNLFFNYSESLAGNDGGARNWAGLLKLGKAVCRHKVMGVTLLLSELGLSNWKIGTYTDHRVNEGHAWVEVLINEGGRSEIFVIEAASGNYIIRHSILGSEKLPFAVHEYTDPNRQIFFASPEAWMSGALFPAGE